MDIKSLFKIENDNIILKIKVSPGSKINKILCIMDNGILKISIQAVAENGKANRSLIEFLSEISGIKEKNIQILSGHKSSFKTILFTKEV